MAATTYQIELLLSIGWRSSLLFVCKLYAKIGTWCPSPIFNTVQIMLWIGIADRSSPFTSVWFGRALVSWSCFFFKFQLQKHFVIPTIMELEPTLLSVTSVKILICLFHFVLGLTGNNRVLYSNVMLFCAIIEIYIWYVWLYRARWKGQLLMQSNNSSMPAIVLLETVRCLVNNDLPWASEVMRSLHTKKVFSLLRGILLEGLVSD